MMTLTSRLLRLGLALGSTAATLHGSTLTTTPTADTYFEAYGSENKNFGAAPILRLDQWGGRRVFLRFAIDTVRADKRVRRATLRLYITEVGFNEQGELPDLKTCVGLYDVVTPWIETGLTYNQPEGQKLWNQGPGIASPRYTDVGPLPKPDLGLHLRQHSIPLDPVQVKKDAWLELDVTDFIRQRVRAADKEVNLVLRASTLGRNYAFCSREAPQTDQRPQLVVELDDQLSDFRLGEVFETGWRRGQEVSVALQGRPPATGQPGALDWSLERKPVPSQLSSTALRTAAAGATFAPDVPGKYRVRLAVRPDKPPARVESGAEPAASESADLYILSVPPHPRLYVTPGSLAKMRQAARSGARLSKAYLDWVKSGSASLTQGKFHDMALHEGCENNALAWLLTGERQYLSNSIAYAQQALAKPMRAHFQDVHAATFIGASWVHALAVHYDWCCDQLTAEHRQAVAAWLKEAAAWGWARSGAPIAHNDGGARQCLLGGAALALLGDDPAGPDLYRRSRQNFEENLLPWLNDGGRGGRCGDGGEYEGLHGFYIVKYAWMSQTATGEDLFSESPFFFNRLRHILFGWYPRRLLEKTGAYSMRQYYSPSGDHIRLGYVGDTQPYQSAAALCARFRDTPEAQAVRGLAGDWPTQWMQYTLRWAVLGDWEGLPARAPTEASATRATPAQVDQAQPTPALASTTDKIALAYFDPGCNTVYMRSDWSDDATWVLFENAPYVSAHDSLDSGTFEIFKGDLLAARTGNCDHGNIGAVHSMNYLHRTIAGNCLLINDLSEKWKGFLAGAEGENDGGGQRSNFPLGSSADADTYRIYRDIFQRGQITRFRDAGNFTYALADLTPAYNNPGFHGGKLNQPKVTSVTRQLLYLRGLDTVLVFDRVSSTKAEFKKIWLLHSLGELDLVDGKETKVDDGEFHYTGATRAVLSYGWPKPAPSFARCLSVTLLPAHAQMIRIGGRTDLPDGQTESFPGDRWHGQHRHHHIKDFWVNGTNYPPGNPPESRWFGEPTSQWYIPGTPDETGGRGKWRLEVSPAVPTKDDVFFHVLCPRLGRTGPFPQVEALRADGSGGEGATEKSSAAESKTRSLQAGLFEGAAISEGDQRSAVFFCRDEKRSSAFSVSLPGAQKFSLLVADLAAGDYRVTMAGQPPQNLVVANDGLLSLANAAGLVRLELRQGAPSGPAPR